jgi:hypothetical protein
MNDAPTLHTRTISCWADGPSTHFATFMNEGRPPRLLGDGCGCKRWQGGENHWHMVFCRKHGREVAEKGLTILYP